MDWIFLSPSHGQFLAVCQMARKNFGRAEGPLYNQRTHFPVLSEKSFEDGGLLLHSRSKRSFHYSTNRMNRGVTILSHGRFPLYFTTDIFPQKLGTLFQKTFLAPDPPST